MEKLSKPQGKQASDLTRQTIQQLYKILYFSSVHFFAHSSQCTSTSIGSRELPLLKLSRVTHALPGQATRTRLIHSCNYGLRDDGYEMERGACEISCIVTRSNHQRYQSME